MRPFIFGIVGWSKTGKTTLVERLVSELVQRGYKVGTLKHDVHGFTADVPGRDSWRHQQAGAAATLLVGPDQMALFRRDVPPSIEILFPLLGDVDLVLAEGFKSAPWPKLEMYAGGPLACSNDPWLIAVVGSNRPQGIAVTWYHWDEVQEIANMIQNSLSTGLGGRWPA